MRPVISIVGKSGTGKTALIERLIGELKGRGYRICTVKHSRQHLEIDQRGKDSYRFAQAGSDAVVVSSPGKLAFIKEVDHEPAMEEILHLIGDDFDLILTEGFRAWGAPKIEVHRGELGGLLCAAEELFAIVTDELLDTDVPQLSLDDTKAIADFIEKNFMPQDKEDTSLFINDKPIFINPFVKDIIARVALAIVSTLKDVGEVRNLNIWVRRKP